MSTLIGTSEAKAILGLWGMQFWRVIWTAFDAREVTPIRWSAKCYRFERAEIGALREKHTLRSRADLARLEDGRTAFKQAAMGSRLRPATL